MAEQQHAEDSEVIGRTGGVQAETFVVRSEHWLASKTNGNINPIGTQHGSTTNSRCFRKKHVAI
jgi:hypothetical protein